MDLEKIAINELRYYYPCKEAIENNKLKIESINTSLYSLPSIDYSKELIKGGVENAAEIARDKLIDERDILEKLNIANVKIIKIVDNVLKKLDEDDRKVLLYFYMDRPKNHIEVVQERLFCSRSIAFKKKDAALSKYLMYRFGAIPK